MFWKVYPSNAMLPLDVVKQVRKPIKRNREPDKAKKKKKNEG